MSFEYLSGILNQVAQRSLVSQFFMSTSMSIWMVTAAFAIHGFNFFAMAGLEEAYDAITGTVDCGLVLQAGASYPQVGSPIIIFKVLNPKSANIIF